MSLPVPIAYTNRAREHKLKRMIDQKTLVSRLLHDPRPRLTHDEQCLCVVYVIIMIIIVIHLCDHHDDH